MRFALRAASILGLLMIATAASAQITMRKIPADAPRGKLTAGALPTVFIDGRLLRLAPGARILTTENLTVTPNLVPAGTLVRYQLDPHGQIRYVWVLTPAEAAAR